LLYCDSVPSPQPSTSASSEAMQPPQDAATSTENVAQLTSDPEVTELLSQAVNVSRPVSPHDVEPDDTPPAATTMIRATTVTPRCNHRRKVVVESRAQEHVGRRTLNWSNVKHVSDGITVFASGLKLDNLCVKCAKYKLTLS